MDRRCRRNREGKIASRKLIIQLAGDLIHQPKSGI
jgi:hypothetical protein